jgi:hypothetical protein
MKNLLEKKCNYLLMFKEKEIDRSSKLDLNKFTVVLDEVHHAGSNLNLYFCP